MNIKYFFDEMVEESENNIDWENINSVKDLLPRLIKIEILIKAKMINEGVYDEKF
jgi:hypothetical protein